MRLSINLRAACTTAYTAASATVSAAFSTVCVTLTALAYHPASAEPLDGKRIALIDAYALATPSAEEASPGSLVRYLSQPARDDTEKARAIFRWVADRISYDVDAYFSNRLATMNADEVLRLRRSICDGYATLFEKLARQAGLEVVTIKGYAKAYGHTPGTRFERPNHAWNAIKINGRWRLVDTTWGAGYVSNGKYVKRLTETFFLAPPEQLMFSHFPLDDAWQLQSTPHLSKAEFEAMPNMEPAFFHLGIAGQDV
jgi:transglutaminase/protease-like cytokinesis protein 3